MTSNEVSAGDVVATPFTDLNLKKGEIPPVLVAAVQRAYSLQALASCQQIASAIGELDALLGEDVDLPQAGDHRPSSGQIAQYAVANFIPFRDVIREVSGASRHERELQAAVLAGVARRAFLKGTGQARGCAYPARAATREVFDRHLGELTSAREDKRRKEP